jgi:hypothetical protein
MNEINMKTPYAKAFLVAVLLITTFVVSCNRKKTISETTILLARFNRATLDTVGTFTQLKILKIYPAKMECSASEKYANLYICKQLINGDTIFVFEECEKVPEFALDTSAGHIPVIDKNDVPIEFPNKVIIFVPATFEMPNNAKYLFAKLSNIRES